MPGIRRMLIDYFDSVQNPPVNFSPWQDNKITLEVLFPIAQSGDLPNLGLGGWTIDC